MPDAEDFHVSRRIELPVFPGNHDAESFHDAVREMWPDGDGDEPSEALVQLVEESLAMYPQSAYLWCILGDLISLGAHSPHDSAMQCYQKAVEYDPLCGEAYESLGFNADILDDPAAKDCLRAGIACDQGVDAYVKLAKLLAEDGDKEASKALLNDALSFYRGQCRRIINARREINLDS